jgi:ketosteroid isomerase-like protein
MKYGELRIGGVLDRIHRCGMTTKEIGQKLVELCKNGKNREAMEQLYAPDIVSVEAAAPAGRPAESKGRDTAIERNKQWAAANEVNGATVDGPYPNGDRFTVVFDFDLTRRADKQHYHQKEVALYTVKNDKIVREDFFYTT